MRSRPARRSGCPELARASRSARAEPALTTQVDGANEHLHNLNRKMKNALKEVRSADRFIIDFILIVIILGIATYCYNMFTGKV